MTLLIGWKVVAALVANLALRCVHTTSPWCAPSPIERVERVYVFDDLVIP